MPCFFAWWTCDVFAIDLLWASFTRCRGETHLNPPRPSTTQDMCRFTISTMWVSGSGTLFQKCIYFSNTSPSMWYHRWCCTLTFNIVTSSLTNNLIASIFMRNKLGSIWWFLKMFVRSCKHQAISASRQISSGALVEKLKILLGAGQSLGRKQRDARQFSEDFLTILSIAKRDQKLRNYMEQVDRDRGIRHDKTPPWSCDRMERVNQLLQVSHIFVIRSGSIFSMAWKFVKGWISPRTASKINVPWLKQRSRECVKS